MAALGAVWVIRTAAIPTEAVLAEMRASDPPVQYLVGDPEGPSVTARERSAGQSPGSRRATACKSNCSLKTANFTSMPRVLIAFSQGERARCASDR